MKTFAKILMAIMAIMLFIPSHGISSVAAIPGAFSLKDLGGYAEENFSSYEGDGFEGFEGYTGEGDDFLDFGGPNKSFATEITDPRLFVMTIANSDNVAHSAYLIPGYLWSPKQVIGYTAVTTAIEDKAPYTTTLTPVYPNGFVRDGAFPDTNGVTGKLTGSGNPKTIEEFFAFIKNTPITCNAIKIQNSVDPTQMDQQLIQRSLSPFRTLEEKIWTPGAYQTQDTYRDKIIVFPTSGLILSDQTQIEYPIVATSSITVTFFCGTPLNPAKALENKRNKAANTFANVGLDNVRHNHAVKGNVMSHVANIKTNRLGK